MNAHLTYLMMDLGCLAGPLLFSFLPQLNFYREWKRFLMPCLLTAAFFLLWDGLFTHLGVWGFNPDYVTGLFFFGMPIEEYLFFICVPYACVFSYHAFTVLFRFNKPLQIIRWFYGLLALVSLIIGILNYGLLYTCSTFLLLSMVLCCLVYRNARLLTAFFFCFLFILIPFMLSNGILTGSFFGRMVVMYNDQENLGIRMGTIPVEDVFYAMLLLLLNVAGFEQRVNKSGKLAANEMSERSTEKA